VPLYARFQGAYSVRGKETTRGITTTAVYLRVENFLAWECNIETREKEKESERYMKPSVTGKWMPDAFFSPIEAARRFFSWKIESHGNKHYPHADLMQLTDKTW